MQQKENHLIYGIHIDDRIQHAGEIQNVLTEYGHSIKTRLGLHEVANDALVRTGVILLEMVGTEEICDAMAEKLEAIEGVEVKKIIFRH